MYKSIEEQRTILDGHEVSIECFHIINDRSHCIVTHYHDYIEILYMIDGTGSIVTETEVINFHTGELVAINSNKPHDVVNAGMDCEYVVIKLKPQILHSSDISLFEAKYMIPFVTSDNPIKIFPKDSFGDFDIKTLMLSIDREWKEKQMGYEMSIRAEVLRLFTWMIRYLNKTGDYDMEKLNFLSISSSAIKKLLFLALDENKELSCAEAAKFCNMSYSYFSRIFKQLMGMSYTSYLTHLRINKADRMLVTTDYTITQIASACGFSSDAYFVKCFRKTKGITPGQYRAHLDRENQRMAEGNKE